MTEKRFEYIRTKYRHYIQDVEKDGEYRKGYRGTYDDFDLDKITDLLNKFNNENEQLKQKYDNSVMLSARIQVQNDELRERNNRQAETIDNLYSLIKKEDWKGLTKLIDEMNEAEELNRLEFEAYCGDSK